MRAFTNPSRATVAGAIVLSLAILPLAPCFASEETAQAAGQTAASPAEKKDETQPGTATPQAEAPKAKPAPAKDKKKGAQTPASPVKPVDPKKAPAKDAAKTPATKPKGQVNTIEDLYAEPESRQASAGPAEHPQGT